MWLLTGALLAVTFSAAAVGISAPVGLSAPLSATVDLSALPSSLSGRAPAALQLEPFVVEGTISNGTAGTSAPAAVEVRVVGFTSEALLQSWTATTDEDGRFRVEGIARVEGASYAVGVDYADAAYLERVTPPGPGGVATQDLVVYESSSTDPGIRFEQSAFVLSQAEAAARTVAVVEIHSITNPTDRTFVPRSDGPGGPTGLLVFGLPPNASELTPEIGLDPDRVVQIDRGFASFTPILPGRVEVVFRYRIPYTTGSLELSRTARYPIASFQVLSPADGPRIESAQMAAAESAAVGGRQFQRLSGGPLAPGNSVTFTISGLPVPGGVLALVPPWSLATGGILVAVVLVLMTWVRGRRAARREAFDGRPEELVEQIVALDLALAEGRIGADEHHLSRAAMIDAAARHMAGRGQVMSDREP